MIIDKNGVINIENLGLVITPEFTVDKLKLNDNVRFSGSNSGYDRYLIGGMFFDDLPFGGLFIFYNNKIAMIILHYKGITGDKYLDITTEERELTQKKHEELLIEQHGAINIKYSWGRVGLGVDIKVNSDTSIVITYNNFPIKGRD